MYAYPCYAIPALQLDSPAALHWRRLLVFRLWFLFLRFGRLCLCRWSCLCRLATNTATRSLCWRRGSIGFPFRLDPFQCSVHFAMQVMRMCGDLALSCGSGGSSSLGSGGRAGIGDCFSGGWSGRAVGREYPLIVLKVSLIMPLDSAR